MSVENQLGIVATIQAKEGEEETVLQALKDMAFHSRQEPGCTMFEVHLDRESPGTFVVFERWASDEALKIHFGTPHLQNFIELSKRAFAGRSVVKKLQPVAT